MSNNIKAVVTLKQIISNVLLDLGKEGDMGEYLRYLNFGTRIWKDLTLFHMNTANTVRLAMSSINTIELPDDFMMFISLSIPVNGQSWTFTRNERLIIPATENCGVLELDSTEGEGVDIGDGRDLIGYGLPGGRNEYYYKLDTPNNRIIISGFNRSSVTLTYVGTGLKIGEQTMIPKIAEEAMIAGIHMLKDRRDRMVAFNQKQYSEELYNLEVDKLRLVQAPTMDELMDVIYETIYQSIKR
jgi:hypothetical protein